MIDLHCHSNFSDGLHSPQELLHQASNQQLKILALTDHDTIEGCRQLLQLSSNIKIIPGIELSTRWKKFDIHILGYNIDLNCGDLEKVIAEQQLSRFTRAKEIGERLHGQGISDAFDKAKALAGHQRIGRPHFAQVLVNEGLVKDKQTAFTRYLGRNKPAYVPTPWMSVELAVQTIVQAGGQAVLAHPLKYCLSSLKLNTLIHEFKLAGGCGLEVVSGEMQAVGIKQLTALALKYDLLSSSGSDFHGEGRSRIALGRQQQLPESCQPIWQQWIN